MKKKCLKLIVVMCLVFLNFSWSEARETKNLYQVSTINALLSGHYDGEIDMQTLSKYGDFGIGTFDKLDGEMISLDGQVYKVKASGKVELVANKVKTPFAAVTYFTPEISRVIFNVENYEQLQTKLNEVVSDKNYFYAIKVSGDFKEIKTRSVPSQEKPYKPLVEITKNQPVFEYKNIKGTILGFYCPAYVAGVNVPGYHLHFLSQDKTKGGHLLAASLGKAQVEVCKIDKFTMQLPRENKLEKLELLKDYSKELLVVEK